MANGLRRVVDDFGKTTVIFDPVGQGPGQECQNPVALDLFLVTDLILIKGEVVFKFAERFLDAPAQEISFDDGFRREGQVIGNEDMNIFLIGVRPFIEDKEDLELCRAIFEVGLEAVSEDRFGFAVGLGNKDRFKFMGEELFNERDDKIGTFVDALFGDRVGPKDGAVDFDFGNQRSGLGSDKFD